MHRTSSLRSTIASITIGLVLAYPAESSPGLHGTLTGTTNYADRWYSKSNNSIAIQTNLDYEFANGLYLGSSAASIDYPDQRQNSAQVEVTPYLGWSLAISKGWRIDLQWTGYLLDDQIFGHNADFHEFYFFMHFRDLLSARISYANDYYGLNHNALDYALDLHYPLTNNLQLSVGAGYAQTQAALGSNYPYWHAGLSYSYKFTTLALRYQDAAETGINSSTEEQKHQLFNPPLLTATAIFSISVGF